MFDIVKSEVLIDDFHVNVTEAGGANVFYEALAGVLGSKIKHQVENLVCLALPLPFPSPSNSPFHSLDSKIICSFISIFRLRPSYESLPPGSTDNSMMLCVAQSNPHWDKRPKTPSSAQARVQEPNSRKSKTQFHKASRTCKAVVVCKFCCNNI